eukprot:TRINITY_DN96728_c0_g1_i1.p1 TRINITY_DN96728_c0_g1~~TRINITY_DN96728_c0_g1_i1.p1  ORF type:complete len:224 (-),score=29.10 TRINITY_DN96728_c0_g1_i1:86-703(-)
MRSLFFLSFLAVGNGAGTDRCDSKWECNNEELSGSNGFKSIDSKYLTTDYVNEEGFCKRGVILMEGGSCSTNGARGTIVVPCQCMSYAEEESLHSSKKEILFMVGVVLLTLGCWCFLNSSLWLGLGLEGCKCGDGTPMNKDQVKGLLCLGGCCGLMACAAAVGLFIVAPFYSTDGAAAIGLFIAASFCSTNPEENFFDCRRTHIR